jgi:hypothetical protein
MVTVSPQGAVVVISTVLYSVVVPAGWVTTEVKTDVTTEAGPTAVTCEFYQLLYGRGLNGLANDGGGSHLDRLLFQLMAAPLHLPQGSL